MRWPLFTLSLVAPLLFLNELLICELEATGRRRECGTESLALAGLFSLLTPRAGLLRSFVLSGMKGRSALWMKPL